MARKKTEKMNPETGEILPPDTTAENAVTIVTPAGPPAPVNLGSFAMAGPDADVEVVRHVAIPVLSFPDNDTIVFRIMDEIKVGKILKDEEGKRKKMEPAHVMTIASVTGELRTLVVGTVLESELTENYPGGQNKYIGRWFRVTKHAKRVDKGKDYSLYSVQEVKRAPRWVELPLLKVA